MTNTISFLPFQNLESGRLLLRQITPEDVPAIFKLRSNPETMKYVPRPVLSKPEEAQEHYKLIQDKIEKNEGINWAITLKPDPYMIGIIGHYRIKWEHFRSEIGYMLLPEYHGKGIISEAVKLMIDYGFGYMKMHSLEAIIDPANLASAKVLEKNKFVKEGHFRQHEFFNGKFLDSAIYSLLKEDYLI